MTGSLESARVCNRVPSPVLILFSKRQPLSSYMLAKDGSTYETRESEQSPYSGLTGHLRHPNRPSITY